MALAATPWGAVCICRSNSASFSNWSNDTFIPAAILLVQTSGTRPGRSRILPAAHLLRSRPIALSSLKKGRPGLIYIAQQYIATQANRKCPYSSVAFVPHATDPTRMRLPSRLAAISSFVLLPSRLAAISLAVRPCFPDWRQCRSVLASAFPPGGSRFFNALTSRSAVSASCVFALPDWRQTHSRPPAWRPLIPAADESARSAAVAVSLSLQISRTKL